MRNDPAERALPRKGFPIRWKWTVASLLLSTLILMIVGGLTLWSFKSYALAQVEKNLAAEAALAADLFRGPLAAGADRASLDASVDRIGKEIHTRLTLIRNDGTVVGDSYESGPALLAMENHLNRPEVQEALTRGTGTAIRFSDTVRLEMFYLAARIDLEGRPVGIVRLAVPLTDFSDQLAQMRHFLLLALVVAFAGSMFLSLYFSRRLTAPILEMTGVAHALSKGALHQRVRVRTGDEVEALGQTFNQMAEELQKKIDALSDDRAQTLAILSGMVEGVLVLDGEGKIVLTNHSFERMFGADPAGWTGRYHYEALRQHKLNELIEEVIRTGRPRPQEIQLDLPRRTFQAQASITERSPRSVVLVFHDITEIKRLERMRKDFVANVSHELRTPLAAMKGSLETLLEEDEALPPQAKEFLMILQRHTGRMENIVRDLLQLSRIESGLDPIRQAPIRLDEAIQKNILLLRPLAEKKNQTLTVAVSSGLMLRADPEKLNTALINLIDNAIKYTPAGGTIAVRASEEEQGIVIEIEDDGLGVPPADRDRIFERFYRVDRTRSRELGGTGLGLAIVKHIMEAHRGAVTVEGRSGKGSKFTLVFPK